MLFFVGCETKNIVGKYSIELPNPNTDPRVRDKKITYELILNKDKTYRLIHCSPIVEYLQNNNSGSIQENVGSYWDECKGKYTFKDDILRLENNQFKEMDKAIFKKDGLYIGSNKFEFKTNKK